jgi:acyl-CoA synthetase (AMP-forming)/AMP-acid ligase II
VKSACTPFPSLQLQSFFARLKSFGNGRASVSESSEQEIPMTVLPTQMLMQRAQSEPDGTAFVFQGDVWTYRKFAEEVERVAGGLAANGVKAGDRVILHMTNRPEMLMAYYACFRVGAIAVPLNTAFKLAEIAPMLRRLRPALYIGESSLYPNVAAIDIAVLPREKRVILDDGGAMPGVQSWEALTQSMPAALSIPPANEPAVFINTSGTTGQPKFVMHTPETLAASTDLICKHFGISADDVVVSPLPLAHGSGLFCSLSLIQAGAPFIMLQPRSADLVLDSIERYRATWLLGIPFQYAALLEAQQTTPRDLSSLRVCLTGADTCPIDLQKRVTAMLGAPLYNLWGASEVVGQLTFGLQPGPVIRTTADAQIRLVDESGIDVAHGEIGELLIRGKNVFVGYWNDPAGTAQSLKNGWYHTGDLMRREGKDELWFVSRKKDIIICGGANVSPVEIEDALVASHPAVEEAGVVGLPDLVRGQRVFGFVKLAPGATDGVVGEILESVAGRLASYKMPEGLRVIDKLPRNAIGKVDRRALERMIDEDVSAGFRPEAVPARALIEAPPRRVARKR